MFKRGTTSRRNGYGVAKIQRATYNTKSGFSVKGGWWELQKAVMKRDNGYCVPCFKLKKLIKATEVHHVIPLSRGGTNTMGNCISVCDECHNARHNHLARSR